MNDPLFELALKLANSDDPAGWLRQVDNYITAFNKDPDNFVLPKAHKAMAPLIEEYAYDLDGFVRFLGVVRGNSVGANKQPMQGLYRTINGRLIQQQRRERFDRALTKAIAKYGKYADFIARQRWLMAVEQDWRNRRLLWLEAARGNNNRLSRDEVADELEQFWKVIDDEIEQGQVPDWSFPDEHEY